MILLEGISKSFGTKPILDKVSYHFPAGERLALIGANGAGKSTLLNILVGLEDTDSGRIIRPSDLTVGYLPQEPNPKPARTVLDETIEGHTELLALSKTLHKAAERMRDSSTSDVLKAYDEAEAMFRLKDGYALPGKAATILHGLGFSDEAMQKSPLELSGGWRMRVELARLLVRNPDFLILDEPTNHLDLPSLLFVETFLLQFRGTLLFVSHDRSLLDRLAARTLHLQAGHLTEYIGNFSSFLDQHAERKVQIEAQRQKLEQRRTEMEKFVSRFGAKASKASQAQSRVKMISRLRALEEELPEDEATRQLQFRLPQPKKTGRIVLSLKDLAIGYDKPLTDSITIEIERGWKVAVIGANGLGKSTLLKTIAQKLPPIAGDVSLGYHVDVAYFAQDQRSVFQHQKSLLDNLSQHCDLDPNQARGLLGMFLFRGDEADKPFEVLSGGEKSRMGLAALLASKANLLLLDEPTNHLDMTSISTLTSALDDFEGNVLFVSHDRDFISSICTHVLVLLPGGKHFIVPGSLSDAMMHAARLGYPDLASPATAEGEAKSTPPLTVEKASTEPVNDYQQSKQRKRQFQQLERQRSKLESELETLRYKAGDTEATMATVNPADHSELAKLQSTLSELQELISGAEDRWLEVSMQIEELEV